MFSGKKQTIPGRKTMCSDSALSLTVRRHWLKQQLALFCVDFAYSPCACVGVFMEPWFHPKVLNHAL